MIIPGVIAGGRQTAGPATTLAQEIAADLPVWYCRHNETSGSVAVNATGGANGTYLGSPVFGAAAIYVGGLTCWDTNNSSRVAIPGALLPTPNTAITILMVLKRKSAISIQAMIDRDGSPRYWQHRFNTTNVEFVKTTGTIQGVTFTSVGANGEVLLLIVTVSSAGSVSLYKNGAQFGTTQSVTAADYGNNTQDMLIGVRSAGSDQLNAFVSESAVYNYALSPARIAVYGTKFTPI